MHTFNLMAHIYFPVREAGGRLIDRVQEGAYAKGSEQGVLYYRFLATAEGRFLNIASPWNCLGIL